VGGRGGVGAHVQSRYVGHATPLLHASPSLSPASPHHRLHHPSCVYTFRANAEIGKLARAQGLTAGGGGIAIQLGATSTVQCSVVVPQGVQPGQTFQINVNGTIMGVQCPAGMGPGSTFSIQTQTQPQLQVAQAVGGGPGNKLSVCRTFGCSLYGKECAMHRGAGST